jgi:5'-nucleotidase
VTLQILLTNDDGIDSPGMTVVRRAVDGLGQVSTVAPDRNNSAVARGITIGRALHLRHMTFGDGRPGIACDGTPSDCVRIGLLGVETPAPDIVISGVNLGANTGADITYSGTVAAALEAALRGKPALAFSVGSLEPRWLEQAAPVIRTLVARVVEHGLPRHSILNVNLPDRPLAEFAGIRPARLGGASCHDRVCLDGDGSVGPGRRSAAREFFLPCEAPPVAEWADTDIELLALGFVAVTPIHYDLLDAAMLAQLSAWDLDLDHVRTAGS